MQENYCGFFDLEEAKLVPQCSGTKEYIENMKCLSTTIAHLKSPLGYKDIQASCFDCNSCCSYCIKSRHKFRLVSRSKKLRMESGHVGMEEEETKMDFHMVKVRPGLFLLSYKQSELSLMPSWLDYGSNLLYSELNSIDKYIRDS